MPPVSARASLRTLWEGLHCGLRLTSACTFLHRDEPGRTGPQSIGRGGLLHWCCMKGNVWSQKGSICEQHERGTLVATPSTLSLKPHKPVSLRMTLVHSEPPSLHYSPGFITMNNISCTYFKVCLADTCLSPANRTPDGFQSQMWAALSSSVALG